MTANDVDVWNLEPGDVVIDGEGVLWEVSDSDDGHFLTAAGYDDRLPVRQAEGVLGVLRPVSVVGVVRGARDAAMVARFLPSNYAVVAGSHPDGIVIAGQDVAGWTWDDYIVPRLSSGLMGASRIERDAISV